MAGKSPANAGKEAAERTPEEQAQVLADAKAATDKQQAEVADAAGNAPAAPDDTTGTPVGEALDGVGPAPVEDRVPELSDDKDAPEAPVASAPDVDADGTIVYHADQQIGRTSGSALAVSRALKLTPSTEWDERLDKAIKAFQEALGQRSTGYLTRDQCRRLGLSYLVS